MKKLTGILFEIKRFSTHDGPGVRTTLFLKGCPLHCRWCHNPESIAPQPQLAYYKNKCINCGECVAVCPEHAHVLANGQHSLIRDKCRNCGTCEVVCLGNALRLYGREITVDEAVKLAAEDRDFYDSDGGVTLSGGEPLLQAEFCYELFSKLRQDGINTAVDTCGCVDWNVIERIIPVTDLFLFDFKHSDSSEHRRLTGRGNELIIANLQHLSESGAGIEIRIPLIPGSNDSETNLLNTGKLLRKLKLKKVKVIPYHAMARTKYAALGISYTMVNAKFFSDDSLQHTVKILQDCGVSAVSGKD